MSSENVSFTTEQIREKIRADCKIIRDSNRSKKNDCLRIGLGEIQIRSSTFEYIVVRDVVELCGKIRNQKHITVDDFTNLNKAFLQAADNSKAFVAHAGALQTLVKELTGNDSEQRIRACVALCNLSLSDEFVCEKISLAAGSYLVTYLSSTDFRLKQTSLWVIMNILATGSKGLSNLISMKIVPKLFALYASKFECDEMVRDAGQALDLIYSSETDIDDFKKENLKMLYEKMHLIRHGQPSSEFFLKIIFNSTLLRPEIHLADDKVQYLIGFSVSNLLSTPELVRNDNLLKILYSVRILSILLCLYSSKTLSILEKFENMFEFEFHSLLNMLFAYDNCYLIKECLWLIKNVITAQVYDNSYTKSQELLGKLRLRRGILHLLKFLNLDCEYVKK